MHFNQLVRGNTFLPRSSIILFKESLQRIIFTEISTVANFNILSLVFALGLYSQEEITFSLHYRLTFIIFRITDYSLFPGGRYLLLSLFSVQHLVYTIIIQDLTQSIIFCFSLR